MNKTKRVAWHKHLKKAKKRDEKADEKAQAQGRAAGGTATTGAAQRPAATRR